ncbi:MAG: class I SAM-dependent methyltransferase [Pedobacter sp.]|jgi:predicted O-methyltransferase YrrM
MLKLSMAISFLKHWFKAKTRHGVHSPFVYRLVDKVIYDFHAKTVYQDIEQLRRDLLHDERWISITEFGAASNVTHSKQRQVSSVAKNVLKPARLAQLVHRLAADLKPGNIIELGSCLGIATAYLSKAAPQARLISIARYSETIPVVRENLQKLKIPNIELLSGNVDELLPKLIEGIPELDFIVIDGNHPGDAILNYFKWCLPKMSKHSMIVFEDIYRSREMKSAWQEIKSNPEVSVTIDLFWIGLVFVRRVQRKEDFKIRF